MLPADVINHVTTSGKFGWLAESKVCLHLMHWENSTFSIVFYSNKAFSGLFILNMPVSCSARGCTNRFVKDSGISFYRFPKNEERKLAWRKAMKRGVLDDPSHSQIWMPSPHDRVCSKHFIEGNYHVKLIYLPSWSYHGSKALNPRSRDLGHSSFTFNSDHMISACMQYTAACYWSSSQWHSHYYLHML